MFYAEGCETIPFENLVERYLELMLFTSKRARKRLAFRAPAKKVVIWLIDHGRIILRIA